MRWRSVLCALVLSHLLFLALVRFYERSSWLNGWLTYQLALARCGPVGMHLCMIEVGHEVRGAALLASGLTCAGLCGMYCVLQALRRSRRVARSVSPDMP